MNRENLVQKTRVAIIGTVGVPACYGGFESLVDNLLDYTPQDVEYTVFCSSKKYGDKLQSYKGAHLVYLDRDANGAQSILYDYKGMRIAAAQKADVMLILGVSGCLFLPLIRRRFSGKIITNIDGLEWKRAKWKWYARLLLRHSEKIAVKYSDVIVGDNKGITDYIAASYKIAPTQRVELIAYGGDHARAVSDDSLYERYPFCRGPYAVTVCRIEPENNVHVILEAFSRMGGKRLVIVGNWQKSEYGKELKERYAKYSNIHLLEPIYEPHTVNWLRTNAAVYVHGHSAGGTNPSLVEAMNLSLPVLAFDCVYNRATTEDKALYWKSAEDIVSLMEGSTEGFSRVAQDMAEVGKRRYRWEVVARQYNTLW